MKMPMIILFIKNILNVIDLLTNCGVIMNRKLKYLTDKHDFALKANQGGQYAIQRMNEFNNALFR